MDSPTQPDTLAAIRGRATISVPEAAIVMKIGRNQAYQAAADGSLPTLRFGKRLVVPVPKLLAMLGVVDREPAAPAA